LSWCNDCSPTTVRAPRSRAQEEGLVLPLTAGAAPGAEGVCGVVVVDKPAGPTSHDVVDRMRRLFSTRRVGHAGTLDPPATGVLLVGFGRATRILQFLQA